MDIYQYNNIENIVIGTPLVSAKELLSANDSDWVNVEFEKTIFTNERYLPNILVQLGIYPSISEIRRNKPELMIRLDKIDFINIKPKKKRPLWIIVGE